MKKASHLTSWVSIILIAFFAYWALEDQKLSETYLDSDNPKDFSVDNVISHLQIIAKDIHYVGSPYHKEVQSYLVRELKALGLEPEIQRERVFKFNESQNFTHGVFVENVIAKIKGTSSGKSLLVMAHYDSAAPHSYGASDAGSGVATILEAIRVFLEKNESPKNDIIILFPDSEEASLMGARAFLEHHPFSKNVGLALNFEARGSGGPSYMLLETNSKNDKMLKEFINTNPSAPNSNSLMYNVYKIMGNSTDSTPLREIGNINSFLFAYIDDFFDYHTAQDTWQRTDRSSLVHQGDYLMQTLNYFAFSDLDNIEGDQDLVFIRFPFIKLIYYPYSWNIPLLALAILIFIWLWYTGIKKGKINFKKALKSIYPLLLILFINCTLTFGLWQLILIIHPAYIDILHAFPYNGYYYMGSFIAMNIAVSLLIYQKWLSKYNRNELIMGPLVFWLLIVLITTIFLPGGAFLIIPVFFALCILSISLFTDWSSSKQLLIFSILSLPLFYMLVPFIKLLPVMLSLHAMPLGTLFLVLIFSLLTPLFSVSSNLEYMKYGSAIITLVFFIIATVKSGFNEDQRKPSHVRYFYNADTNSAYWGSWNDHVDPFLEQFFGEGANKGNLPEEVDKYAHPFIKTYVKTNNRPLKPTKITSHQDTILNGKRFIDFTIAPQRPINLISLISKRDICIDKMTVNGTLVSTIDYQGYAFHRKKDETILRYILTQSEQRLRITMTLEDEPLEFYLQELSYDLLSNELFKIQPRADYMMPQIGSDAIKTIRSVRF